MSQGFMETVGGVRYVETVPRHLQSISKSLESIAKSLEILAANTQTSVNTGTQTEKNE